MNDISQSLCCLLSSKFYMFTVGKPLDLPSFGYYRLNAVFYPEFGKSTDTAECTRDKAIYLIEASTQNIWSFIVYGFKIVRFIQLWHLDLVCAACHLLFSSLSSLFFNSFKKKIASDLY